MVNHQLHGQLGLLYQSILNGRDKTREVFEGELAEFNKIFLSLILQ